MTTPERRRMGRLGISLALSLAQTIALGGCGDLLTEPDEPSTGAEIYDELWRVFERRYAPFEQRGVDWAAAYQRHLPGPDADEDHVHGALTRLLAELDDGHVTLVAPGRPVFVAQRTFREDTFRRHLNLFLITRRMIDGPHQRGAVRYGVLPGNVAYMHVANWNDPVPGLAELMTYVRDRDGVIVDLRHNPGGDFTNGFPLAARFADRRRLAFTTQTKTGPGPDDFGQRVEWHIEPAGAFQYTGPVVVLTSGFTNSAAERTLMALRTLPHVTTVGSPTAGNHGEKVGGELSNGWQYSVVPQVVTAADGVSYEGLGLPPDIAVENDADEVAAGLDRQLEEALVVLGAGGS